MGVFALSSFSEVSDTFLKDLGEHGFVLHLHWSWQVIISFEDLIIRVLVEGTFVIVFLHEDILCLIGIVCCI